MIDVLYGVVGFVVVLTVLVFVHELGHYLVARWNGVRVDVFSIGFGKELFGWNDSKGTRWRISALPLGGYVKFFGDMNASSEPDPELEARMSPEDRKVAFHNKRVGQRAAIVAAGPLANFVYAIVVLAAMFTFYGQRVTPPEIGRVLPDSNAEAAGFQAGDVVVSVDGERIDRFEEIYELAYLNPGRALPVTVRRGGERISLTTTPEPVQDEGPDGVMREVGRIGILPSSPAIVQAVRPGSPAEEAGLQSGDRILAVDGRPLQSFEELQKIVLTGDGRTLQLQVLRDGDRLTLPVTPQPPQRDSLPAGVNAPYMIGVERAPQPLVRYDPASALWQAMATSWTMVERTGEYLGQAVIGERGTEEIGGPLRIAQVSGQAAQLGLERLVMVSVLLSLNLGLVNLFPIPVLDGGHLMFYGLEALRGRPLTRRAQDYAFRFGLAMLLTLFVFATWNDLVNLRIVERLAGLVS